MTALGAAAAPFGYTLAVWGSGEMLTHFRGPPRPAEVLLFVAGAVAAFALLTVAAQGALRRHPVVPPGPATVTAGALNAFALGLSVGAATLIALIPAAVAWPLASFTATAIYLLVMSLQLAAAVRLRR